MREDLAAAVLFVVFVLASLQPKAVAPLGTPGAPSEEPTVPSVER